MKYNLISTKIYLDVRKTNRTAGNRSSVVFQLIMKPSYCELILLTFNVNFVNGSIEFFNLNLVLNF